MIIFKVYPNRYTLVSIGIRREKWLKERRLMSSDRNVFCIVVKYKTNFLICIKKGTPVCSGIVYARKFIAMRKLRNMMIGCPPSRFAFVARKRKSCLNLSPRDGRRKAPLGTGKMDVGYLWSTVFPVNSSPPGFAGAGPFRGFGMFQFQPKRPFEFPIPTPLGWKARGSIIAE